MMGTTLVISGSSATQSMGSKEFPPLGIDQKKSEGILIFINHQKGTRYTFHEVLDDNGELLGFSMTVRGEEMMAWTLIK